MNQETPSTVSSATVRKADVADIPAMMGVAGMAPTASQWSETQYFGLFAPGSSERFAIVIEQDSTIAGFLVARGFGEEYEIENIAISITLQHQGLGTKLLKEFMRITGEGGAVRIFLEVRESNAAARALYAKVGFVETGERKNYYHNPDEAAVLYEAIR